MKGQIVFITLMIAAPIFANAGCFAGEKPHQQTLDITAVDPIFLNCQTSTTRPIGKTVATPFSRVDVTDSKGTARRLIVETSKARTLKASSKIRGIIEPYCCDRETIFECSEDGKTKYPSAVKSIQYVACKKNIEGQLK